MAIAFGKTIAVVSLSMLTTSSKRDDEGRDPSQDVARKANVSLPKCRSYQQEECPFAKHSCSLRLSSRPQAHF